MGNGQPAFSFIGVVPADVQRIGCPRRGDVEQPLVFGGFLLPVAEEQIAIEPGPLALPILTDLTSQRQGDALFRAPPDIVVGLPGRQVRLGHEHDGELEPLGAVDREQPHDVRIIEGRLALTRRQLIAAPVHVGDELVQGLACQGPCQANELADVGEGLVATLHCSPRGLEACQCKGSLQQRIRSGKGNLASQVLEHLRCALAQGASFLAHAHGRIPEPRQQTAAGPEGQEGLVVNHEQGRPQGAHQSNCVLWFGQPPQQIGEVQDLLTREEARASSSAVGDPVALQGLLEEVDVGEPPEEDRHVGRPRGPGLPSVAVPDGGSAPQELGHFLCHGIGLDPSPVGSTGRFTRWRLAGNGQQHQVGLPGRGRPAPGHRLHGCLKLLFRVVEYGAKEDVERLDEGVVGAKGLAQLVDGPGGLHAVPEPGEVADVAAAEAVYRLLDVANEEALGPGQPGVAAASQQAEESDLRRVGVLQLVDHEVPEPRPAGCCNVRMGTEQLRRPDLQVREVERRQLPLAGLVPPAGVLEERAQREEDFQGRLVMIVPARKLLEPIGGVSHTAQHRLDLIEVFIPVLRTSAGKVDPASSLDSPLPELRPVPVTGIAKDQQHGPQTSGEGVLARPGVGAPQPLHLLDKPRADPFDFGARVGVHPGANVLTPRRRIGAHCPVRTRNLVAACYEVPKLVHGRENTHLP